ncbi:hypothetical protein EDB86DRAFT_143944 [Lactarius hatsudake]|nr:hypothetical protein EDB86DRAFT_143944 [Lactarius hatsudake]
MASEGAAVGVVVAPTRTFAGSKPLLTAWPCPPLGILYWPLSSETGGRRMSHVGSDSPSAPLHKVIALCPSTRQAEAAHLRFTAQKGSLILDCDVRSEAKMRSRWSVMPTPLFNVQRRGGISEKRKEQNRNRCPWSQPEASGPWGNRRAHSEHVMYVTGLTTTLLLCPHSCDI